MRVLSARLVAVSFGCFLIGLSVMPAAWAASQHVFPNLRAGELLSDRVSPTTDEIAALYLYGTLPLIERQSGPYRLDVVTTPYRHLLPLATLDIYHEIQTYAQTEFSDYTVWGMLADFMFHEASRIPYDLERSQALRNIQAVQRRHGRPRRALAYPDALGIALPSGREDDPRIQPSRHLADGGLPLSPQPYQPLFDLRGDHVFAFEEPVQHHGEQRQFYARSDYHAGRGGRNYNPEGIIAQTLRRILQVARLMLDHKALTIVGLGMTVAFIKVAQTMLSRQR